jgi:patatin-like phospholipase/acyl hydrolase
MRILSIDGGGIRGIIPGQVLVALEQKLQKLSGDPNKRIADVFDLVAGTSTGGILTCLYLCPNGADPPRPRFSAEDAVELYLQHGDNIFDVSVFRSIVSVGGLAEEKYSAAPLEQVIQKYLGDVTLSQLLKPCLITAYDITRRKAVFFNSADRGPGRDFYLRSVARATSAAPTYFEPANIESLDRTVLPLIDGGVFANNPAMCACVETFGFDENLTVADIRLLSLGTGATDVAYHYSEVKHWGKIEWAMPMFDILMSGASETVDYQMELLFQSVGRQAQYLRIQPNLADDPDVDSAMDNASEGNMTALQKVGQAAAGAADRELEEFAGALLKV